MRTFKVVGIAALVLAISSLVGCAAWDSFVAAASGQENALDGAEYEANRQRVAGYIDDADGFLDTAIDFIDPEQHPDVYAYLTGAKAALGHAGTATDQAAGVVTDRGTFDFNQAGAVVGGVANLIAPGSGVIVQGVAGVLAALFGTGWLKARRGKKQAQKATTQTMRAVDKFFRNGSNEAAKNDLARYLDSEQDQDVKAVAKRRAA